MLFVKQEQLFCIVIYYEIHLIILIIKGIEHVKIITQLLISL